MSKVIKDCTVFDLIGQGEYGEVYKVSEPRRFNTLAIKIFNSRIEDYVKRENVDELLQTINCYRSLNHPAILACYDFQRNGNSSDRRMKLLTDYCPNGSLENAIPHLNDTQKMINIYGIANGMAYLHNHSFLNRVNICLHYDLAPYNILEDEHFCPKIKDIGFSKCVISKNEKKHIISPYIAPEVSAEGVYTKESEVFSYGCIVYEIFTGKKAFKEKDTTDSQMLLDKIEGYRPEIPKNIPPFIQILIRACWEENPDARPTFKEICFLIEIAYKLDLKNEIEKYPKYFK